MLLWFALLNALLLVPNLALNGANPLISLEALAIWALLCSLDDRRHRERVALALATVYSLLLCLVMADALIRQSLGRGLNLYLELGLVDDTWNLLETNAGSFIAAGALVLLVIALLVLGHGFRSGLEKLRHTSPRFLGKPLWLLTGLAVAAAVTPWIGSPALAFVANQTSLIRETHRTTLEFADELAGEAGQAQTLDRLADTDVIFGFIESYGISTLTDERYQPVVSESLESMAGQLEAAGLTLATGRLRSPIQGGQSWLGHLSALSGHWIKNQLAYETFLSGGYSTLIDDFRRTGHRTLAIMPAITRAWPEGRLFRYDQIYDHDDLGYEGPPFNWVTMPDQYTWSRFQQLREQQFRPVFAELALISSHAPWVPILPVLDDWDTIGNGEVFRQWEDTGEEPVSLWRDPDRVREHYAKAIAYALDTAGGFAARYVKDDTLLVLLGDHQPAPLITGEDASRDVIVHVISANPALVEPFLNGDLPGFRRGIKPDLKAEGALMSRFRPFFHGHFAGQTSGN